MAKPTIPEGEADRQTCVGCKYAPACSSPEYWNTPAERMARCEDYEAAPVMAAVDRAKPQVRLAGEDGNAFAILGRVIGALREAGYPPEEIARYQQEATSGDYDHLLGVTLAWVDEPGDEEDPG